VVLAGVLTPLLPSRDSHEEVIAIPLWYWPVSLTSPLVGEVAAKRRVGGVQNTFPNAVDQTSPRSGNLFPLVVLPLFFNLPPCGGGRREAAGGGSPKHLSQRR
jgi:hypothetical protein